MVISSLKDVDNAVNAVQRQLLFATVLALGTSLLLGYMASYFIARRLKRIERSAEAIAGGDLSAKVPETVEDEIGQLADTFNVMADRLRSAFAQVEYERDRVEVLLNDLSEGVVGVSAEGKVTIANPAASILLDAPMAVGKTIEEALPADVAQLWRDSQQDADFDMVVFAHEDVTLEATTYPVAGDADFTSIVVLRDITAQARLERARRDLIANASHEFKTPLFSLAGSLELIDEGELSPEEQSEFLQIMRQQVDRLRDHGGQHARPLAGRGGVVRAQPGGRGPRRHRPLGAGRVPGAGADQASGALVRGRGRPDRRGATSSGWSRCCGP